MIATKKIPGGKLVTVEWEIKKDAQSASDNTYGKISSIRITGDFFAHPEWCIEEIEKALVGKEISKIKETIEEKISKNSFQIIGFSADDIEALIKNDIEGNRS